METFPRRQDVLDTDRDAAFVTREQLRRWQLGDHDALIVSISHCWESMQHPDPWGFQLDLVAAKLKEQIPEQDVWLFYDFTSLHQFKRSPEEDEKFHAAMKNMHLLYCHENTETWQILELSPREFKTKNRRPFVVYDDEKGQASQGQEESLRTNYTLYERRGWCYAETLWSYTRSNNDRTCQLGSRKLMALAPTSPETFQKEASRGLEFTHHEDLNHVVELQKIVFDRMAKTCGQLHLERLDSHQVLVLADALKHYEKLERLHLAHVDFDAAMAETLAQQIVEQQIASLSLACCGGASSMFKALSEAARRFGNWNVVALEKLTLKQIALTSDSLQLVCAFLKKCLRLSDLHLRSCNVVDEGIGQLAPVLPKLTHLSLSENEIKDAGAAQVAEAIRQSTSLVELDLSENSIGSQGAHVLEQVFHGHPALPRFKLHGNPWHDSYNEKFSDLSKKSGIFPTRTRRSSAAEHGCQLLKDPFPRRSLTAAVSARFL